MVESIESNTQPSQATPSTSHWYGVTPRASGGSGVRAEGGGLAFTGGRPRGGPAQSSTGGPRPARGPRLEPVSPRKCIAKHAAATTGTLSCFDRVLRRHVKGAGLPRVSERLAADGRRHAADDRGRAAVLAGKDLSPKGEGRGRPLAWSFWYDYVQRRRRDAASPEGCSGIIVRPRVVTRPRRRRDLMTPAGGPGSARRRRDA